MNLPSKKFSLIVLVLAAFLIQSCEDDPFRLSFKDAPPPFDTSQAVSDTTIAGGATIFVIEEGEGPFKVVSKDQILVQITGRTEEGRIFDSSFSNRSLNTSQLLLNLTPNPKRVVSPTGQPSAVPPLVEGLRKGLLDMKEGESRTIVIPPNMGYSEQYINKVGRVGQNGFDLRDQTITYDVELLSIR